MALQTCEIKARKAQD